MNRLCLVLLLMAGACRPAAAIDDRLESGLRQCAKETEQVARLACFDALVSTIAAIKKDEFGLTGEIARKRQLINANGAAATAPSIGPAAVPAAQDGSSATAPVTAAAAAEILALPGTIVALRLAPRGEIIFTLDNQQVWMQTQVEPGKRFSLGDTVRIERGLMGSYWLAADKARKTKVTRIS